MARDINKKGKGKTLTVVPATRKIALDKLPAHQKSRAKRIKSQIIIRFQLPMKMPIKESTRTGKSPGSRLNVTWLRLENSRSNTYSSDSSSWSISFSCPDTEDSTGLREKQVETALNLGRRTVRGRCRNEYIEEHRQVTFWRGKTMLLLSDWIAGNGSRRWEEIDIWNSILSSVRLAGDFRTPAKRKKRSDRWRRKLKRKPMEKEKPWPGLNVDTQEDPLNWKEITWDP